MNLDVSSFASLEFVRLGGLKPLLRPNKRYFRLRLDGRAMESRVGAWAVWLPEVRCKFLHSFEGRVHCLHSSAPSRGWALDTSEPLDTAIGKYTLAEWRAAISKTALRRVSEIVVAAGRLHRAGLGPEVLGVCFASKLTFERRIDPFGAIGVRLENVHGLPAKPPATEEEVRAAGVRPDKIRSCLRQQVNGYVVDLNSVVGVVPVDGEPEVTEIEARIRGLIPVDCPMCALE
jgi:hypothetical protein